MSIDSLSDAQFGGYKYKTAHEEGRNAREWLSTEEGHDWQDHRRMFGDTNTKPGFFSVKQTYIDRDTGNPYDESVVQWPYPGIDVDRESSREEAIRLTNEGAKKGWSIPRDETDRIYENE